MTRDHDPSGTLEPGLVVRYLHGELDGDEARAVSEHLEACPACRRLADAIEQGAGRLGAMLKAADPAQPDAGEWRRILGQARARAAARRRTRRRLAAAGWLLLVLAAGAVASRPVRAWMVETWDRVAGRDVDVAHGVETPSGHADVGFRPAGPVLDIVLDSTQPEGRLTIHFGDAETATVRIVDGAAERLVVGERVVRVHNAATSRASYRLVLPHQVDRVRIRIGSGEPVELDRKAVGAGGAGGDVVVDLRHGRQNPGPS